MFETLKDVRMHRRCRAGRNKQRQLKTIITDRSRTENHAREVCHANLKNIPIVTESKSWDLVRVVLCNPRSLNNKFDEFGTILQDLDVDIAGISEYWFNTAKKPIEHFEIDNYVLIT